MKGVARIDKVRNADILYKEFHIMPIFDVIREGKFRWLGDVMRREPPSMLHEVVNSEVKETRRRRRSRTKQLKNVDNHVAANVLSGRC